MKLLLDENLSRRLIPLLEAHYPGSSQVTLLGLERASDRDLWQFAKDQGFVIVSKDSDFHEMCIIDGPPPQVIWIKIGNSGRATIADILIARRTEIESALSRPNVAFVELAD